MVGNYTADIMGDERCKYNSATSDSCWSSSRDRQLHGFRKSDRCLPVRKSSKDFRCLGDCPPPQGYRGTLLIRNSAS